MFAFQSALFAGGEAAAGGVRVRRRRVRARDAVGRCLSFIDL